MRIRNIRARDIYEIYVGRHEPENLRTFARLYWHAVLCVAFFVSIGVFAWGIVTLNGIVTEMDQEPELERVASPTLDRAALTALIRAYDARQARFEALKGGAPASLADPSR